MPAHVVFAVAIAVSASLVTPVAQAADDLEEQSAQSAEPGAPPKPLRLAVYDFELSEVEARLGRIVTDSVVSELRKLQRLSVIGMDEVRAMLDLEVQRQLAGCEDDSCLAEIADALGVDGIVIGTIARIEDQYVFGMRRIDRRRAEVVGGVSYRLEATSGEELLAVIGPAVEELFPDHPLRAGRTRGVAPELALRLNPPPLPVWSFWLGAGATVGSALAAGVLGALSLLATSEHDRLLQQAAVGPVDGGELEDKRQLAVAVAVGAYSALGTAAVLGAGTGVMALFVDWRGYRAESE